MNYHLYVIQILLIILSACTVNPTDSRLLKISNIVADNPEKALAALDSINTYDLSESDRHYFDFLSIKAKDKAYVIHSSDSLILDVINYYSQNNSSDLYPEALYYGGRVYSDLGDLPMALHYFNDAIDALPKNSDLDLKCRILSQTGRLLNTLRIYGNASKYLKEVIRLQTESKDSVNLMQNNQLLGAIYMHAKEYDRADSCFNAALNISKALSHKDSVIQKMYLAGINFYKGDYNNALRFIRPLEKLIPTQREDIYNAYAANIYKHSNILDSAYLYAVKLINSNSNNYRKEGFGIILDPVLKNYSSFDSLVSYSLKYRDVLEEYLDSHDAQQVLMQTSLYNYQIHDRERQKTEQIKLQYLQIIWISLFIILILCMVVMWFRNKNMRTSLLYHNALDDISNLRQSLNEKNKNISPDEKVSKERNANQELRERLKNELLELQKEGKAKKDVPKTITESNAYKKLREFIELKRIIPLSDNIWSELEVLVLEVSPYFKSRLYLLVGDQLKDDAYYLALLIKCGATPTEMSILTGRTKGAISSRRGDLCNKIFGEKLGATLMDDIIRLL